MTPRVMAVFLLWFSGKRDEAETLIRELSLDELADLCVRIDHAKATAP